mmetsp:Transcript_1196/g.2712  ORF Transcript_1196/g.2712 Transcript_1196/m.2712 type:complete len:335 (+) Transcript_1196:144-1148(+)|eukprot:CAMPEP_0116088656 /NCGR_PEP_ID=MMETSP0327-20121206/5985_1 /TAXON_ID=44447 /ORGANISM="Pseudo-nitzschia delicatissima, Strain B596" /LENGTH=334 /DNA_ID=CAMNT_0003579749 /DNA_START=56 /DNA_END=1060 /DNA_ORIENTATION=+
MTNSSISRKSFGSNGLFLAAFILQVILMGSTISGSHGWFSPTATTGNIGQKQGLSISRRAVALNSSESVDVAASGPPFAAIVGNGRIGGALSEAGNCVVLERGDSIDVDGEGPILLATRNDALDEIIDNCPENRRKDLVFLQNGYLDDFLEKKGLSENSQVLLYLSVAAKGMPPTDGVTTFNPEGLTASTGEWAQAFADRLASIDLKCNVVSATDYRPAMFEKLMWISTYMLVGAANNCATVGDAGKDHSDTVESIVKELVAAVSAKEGIEFPEGTLERLKSYTDVVADFPCGVKEFEWRNQYFWNIGDDAVPIHNGLLKECAEKGILPFELPK